MDEGEGGGYGESGDPSAQFHSNEAISAVADDGFLAEEDDDYEDLYNDVNVGEGFLQSLRKNEDSGARNDGGDDKKLQSGPAVQDPSGASIPGAGGGASGEGTTGVGTAVGESRVSGRVEGFQNQGFEGSNSGVGSSLAIGGGGGIRVQLGQASGKSSEIEERRGNDNGGGGVQGIGQQQSHGGGVGSVGNEGLVRQAQGIGVGVGGGGENLTRPGGNSISVVGSVGIGGGEGGGGMGVGGGGGGATILFVGDLHWWTTDAELEDELCKYGQVKEVKFFDEKASGKSKGYCQVEFYESFSATSCKEGMNGHLFNGRPCVVAFASPFTVKKMGEAQNNRNQPMNQTTTTPGRRGGPADAGPRPSGNNIGTGGNFQGGDGNNRGYGRGNWGRGNNPGMGNRGPVNPMRNRGGGMGGRGMMGNGGNGFGQGMGATPPMMHHQSMMNQGFDPAFGGPMGRMGGYGGFPGGPTPPFSGILPSFPGVGGVGLPGVAPHVNPAFFGRGMPMNGMGMMPASGVDGPNMGMWSDPNMGGWGGEEHGGGGRAGESSYGEEAASDHQYGEVSHDRAGYAMREKDRGSEKDWSGTSERRYKDDRDQGYERDAPREKDIVHDHEWSEKKHRDDREMSREQSRERDRDRGRSRDRDRDRERDRDRVREREKYREDRDRYADHHRYRDREPEHEDEWDRGRSSRTHSKSRLPQEEEHHSRSKDADYGKRRRLTSE